MQTNKLYQDVIAPLTDRATISYEILTADFDSIQIDVVASLLSLAYSGIVGGPFEDGEVVTSNTGDTGVFVLDNGTDILIRPTSGTWAGATTATGSDSGAVAIITATVTPSFEVNAIKSNQELPPDPSLPVSGDNFYSYVMETDEATGVNYAPALVPFTQTINPSATSVNISTTGARWMFVEITNITGICEKVNVTLFAKRQ